MLCLLHKVGESRWEGDTSGNSCGVSLGTKVRGAGCTDL